MLEYLTNIFPNEIKNIILLYNSHKNADIIKKIINFIKSNTRLFEWNLILLKPYKFNNIIWITDHHLLNNKIQHINSVRVELLDCILNENTNNIPIEYFW